MLRMQEMTFPGFKFQNPPPIHVWYIGHTRGLQPLLSPSNILSHRKVPFQKMPPHGKILKEGPGKSESDPIGFVRISEPKYSYRIGLIKLFRSRIGSDFDIRNKMN